MRRAHPTSVSRTRQLRPTHPYDGAVRELVCLDMANGPEFVARLRRAWDDGDAVFPLDDRLPPRSRSGLIDALKPTIIATTDGDTAHPGFPVEDGDAVIVATSGSTGEPKGAILTHDAIIASARATSKRLAVDESDMWFACLPPAHVGGLSVITRSLVMNTPLLAVPRFTPDQYIEAARRGATLVSLVATALQRIDPSLYRTIVLGGSRPPTDLPDNVVTTYGMTESGSGVVYDGIPLDGVDIRISNDGEVHLRCPMLMRGYRNAASPFLADGWYPTGDDGEWTHEGRLLVHGRRGDMITTGGEKVWPETVEAVISQIEGCADVCVAGVPDPQWGQAVHAWVVTSGATPPDTESIINHCKETLPRYSAPKVVHFLSVIPRTALGKPQRHLLVRSVPGTHHD